MTHPFFKQARKPEWLAKNLISDIPPIESRPTKKLPQKLASLPATDEWDFNEDHSPKRHISFGHVVVRKPSSAHHHASESWSPTNHTVAPVPIAPPPSIRKMRALSDDFIIESNKTRHQGSAPPTFDKGSRFNVKPVRHEKTPSVTFTEETRGQKSLYRTISHDDNMSMEENSLSS